MPITWLDIILLAFMLVSGLLAMARGFTRELLSILSWVVAALVALWLFPRYQEQAREMLSGSPKLLADVLLVLGIFLVTLVVVTFITIRLADKILDSRVGALDRTFGFVFGLGRGLIIVVIAYLFFTWLVPDANQPQWVREAKSRPVLDYTGEAIRRMLPEDPGSALSKIKPPGEPDEGEGPPEGPPPEGDSKNEDSDNELGYKRTERRSLDQLMESTRGAGEQ
ncbi:MAG: CvpA family protein [Hyphomicrobiales bacterium]|nr:CvpA family protein [Hyphomicrobiales bacterium]